MVRTFQKKVKLGKQAKRTKWAPFWIIPKALGKGKKAHPSEVTHVKRHWKRNKLKIKPRRRTKKHLG